MAFHMGNRAGNSVRWGRRIAAIFAHAIVRRLAFVLVALALAWVGIGKAHASGPTDCYDFNYTGQICASRQEAYASAKAAMDAKTAVNPTYHTQLCTEAPTYLPDRGRVIYNSTPSTCAAGFNTVRYWMRSAECPTGTAWNPTNYTCDMSCPGGYAEDAWNPGQCLDAPKCLARNALPGFLNVGPIPTSSTNKCVGGCEYKSVGGSVCTTLGGVTQCAADMDFSGNPCGTSVMTKAQAVAEKDEKQKCTPAGSGQTFCVKPDGKQCYSSTSGRQVCWDPRETGQKTDSNVSQKRDAGNTPIAPNLNLPNGDTLTQTGTPTSTTTTIINNGSTSIVTTTTTNYTTTNGTSPGPSDNGEPADGSGQSDEDGTSASGGGDCDTPPLVTGDVALNMVATQTWATRCAVEVGNAADVTGDISDCSHPFTVAGTNANAIKLRAMRAQVCPDATAPDESDYLGDGTGEADPSSVYTELGGDFEGWDVSGFGFGTSCPSLPSVTVFGTTYDLGDGGRNDAVCGFAVFFGWLVILGAGISCLRIVTEA